MTLIALLSPALPTPDMDSPSSTHLAITQMGVFRGYERSFKSPLTLWKQNVLSEKFLKCLYSLPPIKDGYQQNYKRGAGQGPRGVSRSSTQAIRSWNGLLKWLWLKNLHHTETFKIHECISPSHVYSDFFVPYQWYFYFLSLPSKWCELWYLEIKKII